MKEEKKRKTKPIQWFSFIFCQIELKEKCQYVIKMPRKKKNNEKKREEDFMNGW